MSLASSMPRNLSLQAIRERARERAALPGEAPDGGVMRVSNTVMDKKRRNRRVGLATLHEETSALTGRDAPDRHSPATAIALIGPEFIVHDRSLGGDLSPDVDASLQASALFRDALTSRLAADGHDVFRPDIALLMEGRCGQILRLERRVSAAALDALRAPPRAHGTRLHWTLGEGARAIAPADRAQSALFVYGGGVTDGRRRMALRGVDAARAAGASLAGQPLLAASLALSLLSPRARSPFLRAVLVDLASGDIRWVRQTVITDGGWTPKNAAGAVARLLAATSP